MVPAPGNPQSLNRYAYANNNPLRYTDPSGHTPVIILVFNPYTCVGIAFVAAVTVYYEFTLAPNAEQSREIIGAAIDNALYEAGRTSTILTEMMLIGGSYVEQLLFAKKGGYIQPLGEHISMALGVTGGTFSPDPNDHDPNQDRPEKQSHLAKEVRNFLKHVQKDMQMARNSTLREYLEAQGKYNQTQIDELLGMLKDYGYTVQGMEGVEESVANEIVDILIEIGINIVP